MYVVLSQGQIIHSTNRLSEAVAFRDGYEDGQVAQLLTKAQGNCRETWGSEDSTEDEISYVLRHENEIVEL